MSGIRVRLVAVALVLLALPLIAVSFIAQMERFLRETQEKEAVDTAKLLTAALSDRPQLFPAAPAEPDAVAEERRRIVALFAAADPDAAASLGNAYVPSDAVERILAVAGRDATRLWVVDSRSRVRGLQGSLRDSSADSAAPWERLLASWLLPEPTLAVRDAARPVKSQVDRALIGVSSVEWRATRDRDVAILSSAQPIFSGDDIVGAVVIEETAGTIQLLKQRALKNLLSVTLVIVAVALAVLLGFATRLAARIRRLHAEADAAIDAQGRVRGSVTPLEARDEIGDLSRTMASVLDRLRDYNAYLESMAGRLSHELRTPVAVVRSSLDNLKSEPLPASARVYVDRANEGVARLAKLISRLSEATRLERLLEAAELERFDAARVIAACVEGYRSAYAPRAFTYDGPAMDVWLHGVPDALAQLLDKLVENANDFAPEGTAIAIALQTRDRFVEVRVENEGPSIPPAALIRLFDSMVTLREAPGEGAHLGLGLYIVRLIAEFHGGRARAENLPGGRGVRFAVTLPAAR